MSSPNNVDTIAKWQKETFGDDVPTAMTVARALQEMIEAQQLVLVKDYEAVAEELADIWITLARGIGEIGLDDSDLKDMVVEMLGKNQPPVRPMEAMTDLAGALVAWQTVELQKELKDSEKSAVDPALASYWHIVQVSRACGVSFGELLEAIAAKMDVNRARTWATEDGVSQHV